MKINADLKLHQREAVHFCLGKKNAGVCYATGTGKTLVAITIANYLLFKKLVEAVFIIGTKNSFIEFQEHYRKFAPSTPLIDLVSTPNDFKSSYIHLSYYKNFMSQFIDEDLTFLSKHKVAFIFDEVHVLKNPSAQQTKFYLKLRAFFQRVYGFTATPVTSSVVDFYNVANFIIPGFFPQSSESFLETFAERRVRNIGIRFIKEIVGYKNLDLLRKFISRIFIYYYPEQDVRVIKVPVELSEVSVEPYYEATKGLFTYTGKEYPSWVNRLIPLQQVVDRDLNKLEAYYSLVQKNLFKGVLTFCFFEETLKILERFLSSKGVTVLCIKGSTSLQDRRFVCQSFMNEPSGKVLLLLRTGTQSLNLHSTNVCILYDIPQSEGHFLQVLGRVVRIFSSYEHFEIYLLIVEGTIDAYKWEFVQNRLSLYKELFSYSNVKVKKPVNAYLLQRLRSSLLWWRERKIENSFTEGD